MRDREIVGLHQAYLDVYSNLNYNQDIVEVVEYLVAEGYADSYEEAEYIIEDMSDEEYENLIENENWETRRREASTRKPTTTPIRVGRKPVLRSSDIQQPDPEVTERRKRRSGRLQYTDMSEPPTRSDRRNLKSGMEYDTFDAILEHLVAEGYADTNESALAIMANMSEEWKHSIVEGYGKNEEDCVDKKDKNKHNCAKKVCHEEFGEGNCIYGQHAEPDRYGFVSHYDVIFEHGIEKAIPTSEMEILVSESHGGHMKK